jgi:hypothetical protein
VDIIGCAETNIAWQESNRKFAQALLKQQNYQAHLATSSSLDTSYSNYQPGGVTNSIIGK